MKSALLAALLFLPIADKEVTFGIDCKQGVCIVPQQLLMDLVNAHNEQVDEIHRLEALCPRRNT